MRAVARTAAVATLFVVVSSAAAATLDRAGFRYTRELAVPGAGPVLLEPDGALYAHTRPDLADLRIVDARGRQVAWRPLPAAEARARPVQLLNRGRQAGRAVALIDLGPVRDVYDRIELELPDTPFVGSVEVLGSDARSGGFTSLSTTQIYDVRGAQPVRSTTAVFPPTDHRYLLLRARGVSEILGATVAYDPSDPLPKPVPAKAATRQRGSETIVLLDLGFRNVPVDEVRVESTTRRFDRPVTVSGSNDGKTFVPVGAGSVVRFAAVALTSVPVTGRHRYLRLAIENGDDPPLAGLDVLALAHPRTLLVEGGFRPPYRLLYGDPSQAPPRYDFASLPRAELGLENARPGRLGAESRNPLFEPPADTRSFAKRHPVVVQGALALAAIAVAGAGLIALRRRT